MSPSYSFAVCYSAFTWNIVLWFSLFVSLVKFIIIIITIIIIIIIIIIISSSSSIQPLG